MKIIVSGKKGNCKGSYSPELRSFVMTLKFYSSKVYRFVRKTFKLSLPHPAVIRSYYSAMDGKPGFTKTTFSALAVKVAASGKTEETVVCSLMLDRIAIRKKVD